MAKDQGHGDDAHRKNRLALSSSASNQRPSLAVYILSDSPVHPCQREASHLTVATSRRPRAVEIVLCQSEADGSNMRDVQFSIFALCDSGAVCLVAWKFSFEEGQSS
jgi:hypothetical protein